MIRLPSLDQLNCSAAWGVGGVGGTRIWLASQPTDMRCGFDRLAELARTATGHDPVNGHLFLFRSRRGDRIKVLYWDKDGMALWYKRLEVGVFKLPRIDAGVASVELRASDLAMLLDGIDMRSVKKLKRYTKKPGQPESLIHTTACHTFWKLPTKVDGNLKIVEIVSKAREALDQGRGWGHGVL